MSSRLRPTQALRLLPGGYWHSKDRVEHLLHVLPPEHFTLALAHSMHARKVPAAALDALSAPSG